MSTGFESFPTIEIRLGGIKTKVIHCLTTMNDDLEKVVEEEFDKAIRQFNVRAEVASIVDSVVRDRLRRALADAVAKSFDEYRGELDLLVKMKMKEVLDGMADVK